MKLTDIEPRLEKNEGVAKEAHERIDLMLEREKQMIERLEALEAKHAALVHSYESHNHDETPTLLQVAAEAAEEVTETVQEAAEEITETAQEAAEEVIDTLKTSGQEQEESDGDDATFPEETAKKQLNEVEPVPETDDAPPVDDHVEVINKETGKTHRIDRNLLAQIVAESE